MESSNIENQVMPHTCTSNKERAAWIVLTVVVLVLGILVGMFLIPHSPNSNGQVSMLAQQQQIAQQLSRQQAAMAIPLSGQVVSISHTGAQSGTIRLRVSFDRTTGPTFQNPIPRPNIHPVANTSAPTTSTQAPKGIKIITISFTKDTTFTNKKASEIKAGDYLNVRSTSENYASGKPFTATQVSYFNPTNQIEQMVTGGGHTLFGKITSIKAVGTSKVITMEARVVNGKEFTNILLTKVATRPYPHTLLQSDVPFTKKSYTVTINSDTHVNNINGAAAKLAVGTMVAVSSKEDTDTTNKVTAISLSVLPPSPASSVK